MQMCLQCLVNAPRLNIAYETASAVRSASPAAGDRLRGIDNQSRRLDRSRRVYPTEEFVMKKLVAGASTLAVAAMLAFAPAAQAQKQITLCWAAWDPANALVELSKDFTAKSGIQMKFEFVPWPNFADRMLNELNSKGKLCDLMIGDSQWLGGSAENAHYVKLNEFFDKNGIKMSDFAPAT